MNINFDWNDFKNNKIAVRCINEDVARDFVNKCFDNNLKWYVESNNLNKKINYDYGCKTTYSFEGHNLYRTYDDWYKESDYTIFEWSDFINTNNTYKEFTKQDLKDGMVVELNNGQLRFLFNESLINKNGYIPFDEYFNNKLIYNNNPIDNYTIKRIYKTKGKYFSNFFDAHELELIWERKEEPKEMTVEEIEKRIGL